MCTFEEKALRWLWCMIVHVLSSPQPGIPLPSAPKDTAAMDCIQPMKIADRGSRKMDWSHFFLGPEYESMTSHGISLALCCKVRPAGRVTLCLVDCVFTHVLDQWLLLLLPMRFWEQLVSRGSLVLSTPEASHWKHGVDAPAQGRPSVAVPRNDCDSSCCHVGLNSLLLVGLVWLGNHNLWIICPLKLLGQVCRRHPLSLPFSYETKVAQHAHTHTHTW